MAENNDQSKTYLHFFLRGKSLDPQEVTLLLKIEPSMQHKVGDLHGKQRDLIWKTGFWLLDTKDHVASLDIEQHLNWLLALLEPVREQLSAIISRVDVYCELKVVSSLFRRDFDIEIDSKTLGRIANLNVPLAISVTYLSYSDEEENM